jgi:hypothetical protein
MYLDPPLSENDSVQLFTCSKTPADQGDRFNDAAGLPVTIPEPNVNFLLDWVSPNRFYRASSGS